MGVMCVLEVVTSVRRVCGKCGRRESRWAKRSWVVLVDGSERQRVRGRDRPGKVVTRTLTGGASMLAIVMLGGCTASRFDEMGDNKIMVISCGGLP